MNRERMPTSRTRGGYRITRTISERARQDAPLVSIITAVRNGKDHLAQTIRSVLDQTYPNIEYIIIDGASTDGTLDIIRSYEERVAYWVSEQDLGIYDAMNKGIAASTGELINLLNADDFLEQDAVEAVVTAYISADRPDIVYGNARYLDDRYGVSAEYVSRIQPWIGMTINHQSMFVTSGLYDRIGAYDAVYRYAGDYDFFLRCVRQGAQFLKIDRPLVNCRNDGANVRFASQSRKEASRITRIWFGRASPKRVFFLMYNYLVVPVKFRLRTLLYETLGAGRTRKLLEAIKPGPRH